MAKEHIQWNRQHVLRFLPAQLQKAPLPAPSFVSLWAQMALQEQDASAAQRHCLQVPHLQQTSQGMMPLPGSELEAQGQELHAHLMPPKDSAHRIPVKG